MGAGAHVEPRDAVRAGRARGLFARVVVSDRSEVVAIPPHATAGRPLSRGSGEGPAPRGGLSRRDAAAAVAVQPVTTRGRPFLFRAETGKPERHRGTSRSAGRGCRVIRYADADPARSVAHG